MTKEILKHMNLKLKELLPYQFYEWRTKAEYPYWIGEYSETSDTSEDGSGEDVMMITGTTKGTYYCVLRHFNNDPDRWKRYK